MKLKHILNHQLLRRCLVLHSHLSFRGRQMESMLLLICVLPIPQVVALAHTCSILRQKNTLLFRIPIGLIMFLGPVQAWHMQLKKALQYTILSAILVAHLVVSMEIQSAHPSFHLMVRMLHIVMAVFLSTVRKPKKRQGSLRTQVIFHSCGKKTIKLSL